MSHFVIQYTLVILAVILIPVLLRMGKEHDIATLTYIVFGVMIAANLAAYLLLDMFPSYIYVSVIIALAACLVRRRKKDEHTASLDLRP